MSLDPKIREAITESAREVGQDAEFANKLIAWMEELSTGNSRLDDNDSVKMRLNVLYDATKIASPEQRSF